jgi:hypothetical protein
MAGLKARPRPAASPVETMRVLAVGAALLLAAGIGALTGRELARYAGLGLGLVVLVAAVAGISSALS